MKVLALSLLAIALILEASITTVPLVFLVLLCLVALYKNEWLFILAFIFGLLLDVVSFRTIGLTSIFFMIFLFIVLLYQSKFEIATKTFIFFTSLTGSLIYLFLMGNIHLIIIQAAVSSFIGLLLFKLIQKSKLIS